jgi:hypothetical protein
MTRRLLLFGAVLAIWANAASAAIIVALTGIAVDSPGVWDWTYTATLQPDQNMRPAPGPFFDPATVPGDFFTIYDLRNIAPGTTPTFGPSLDPKVVGHTFTTTQSFLGLTPSGTTPPDSAAIPNVTVQLTGGGVIVGDPTQGQITLGTLHIKSTTDQAILNPYRALAQQQFGGTDSVTTGFVNTPIPEPTGLALLMVGLVAVGGLAYRRRQV